MNPSGMSGWTGRQYRGLSSFLRLVAKHVFETLNAFLGATQWKQTVPLFRRLLAQLRDMESAFDGFFEKHRLKLHQYLQLLRYEQSFQEVRILFLVRLACVFIF